MDLDELARTVLAQIDSYVYPYVEGLVGRPWSAERVKAGLDEFRSALVPPYLAAVVRQDTIEQIEARHPPTCRCAIVADDGKGTLLAFDPDGNEFHLVRKRADRLETFGVSGDAVGCFMAR
jgi:hypothetical protein